MSVAEELEKLANLRQNGAISEDEFEEAKRRLLNERQSVSDGLTGAMDAISPDANTWAMLLHLSQFCGYIAPLAGLVVPIVLWQVKKGDSEIIDRHGRIVANWIISELIYWAISAALVFVFVGIPLAIAVGVVVLLLILPVRELRRRFRPKREQT